MLLNSITKICKTIIVAVVVVGLGNVSGYANVETVQSVYSQYQKGNFLTALQQAKRLAKNGDAAAQALVAEIYWNGQGISKNQNIAIVWYQTAADNGHIPAQFRYAQILANGEGGITKDTQKAKIMFTSAAKNGNHKAQYELGKIIIQERPTWAGHKRALPWFEKAAKAGYPKAQYELAKIYKTGKGIRFTQPKLAVKWLEKAANGGVSEAQRNYAKYIIDNAKQESDIKKAKIWLEKAARGGNHKAQNQLARYYVKNKNPDITQALVWHLLAKLGGETDIELEKVFAKISNVEREKAIKIAENIRKWQ